MQYPQFDSSYKSLMAKHLSKEIFDELSDLETKNGFTLQQAINSGVQNKDSSIGIYAGDKESYLLFEKVLNPIIQEYHKFSKEDKHISNFDIDDLDASDFDDMDKYIISTRIRVGRNIDNMPLGPAISKDQRLEIEKRVSTALLNLDGEFEGEYFSLDSLSAEQRDSHFSIVRTKEWKS